LRIWSRGPDRYAGIETTKTIEARIGARAADSERTALRMAGDPACSVCRQPILSTWICVVCERAGIRVVACSPRCRRVHARDGRHRKELKAAAK